MDYRSMIQQNIRAARARIDAGQPLIAQRMTSMGFRNWTRQTVSNLEQGRRDLNAYEVLGLAAALEVTIAELLDVRPQEGDVEFVDGGEVVGAVTIYNSVRGIRDGAVRWNGDLPSITRPATPHSARAWERTA